jgi:hypothetical protein
MLPKLCWFLPFLPTTSAYFIAEKELHNFWSHRKKWLARQLEASYSTTVPKILLVT